MLHLHWHVFVFLFFSKMFIGGLSWQTTQGKLIIASKLYQTLSRLFSHIILSHEAV